MNLETSASVHLGGVPVPWSTSSWQPTIQKLGHVLEVWTWSFCVCTETKPLNFELIKDKNDGRRSASDASSVQVRRADAPHGRSSCSCGILQSWTKVLGTASKYEKCFANRSVFNTLKGHICAKWRPQKVHFQPADSTLTGGGGGGNRKGKVSREKVHVSQHFCPGLSQLNDQTKDVDNFALIYRIAAKFGLVSLRDFLRLLGM